MSKLRSIWRRITASRRAREREAAAQRECALRQDFARRTHALESQILLLRAENRALLNSVLGIAGIPPIMVTDPAELSFVPATPSGVHNDAHPSPLSSRQRADVWPDEGTALGVGEQGQKQIPRTAVRVPKNQEENDSARDSARDDSSQDSGGRENSATSPCTIGTNSTPPQRSGQGAVPLRRRESHRARPANGDRIVTPMRRRSWHQIYRMLELESSRRKASEPQGTT